MAKAIAESADFRLLNALFQGDAETAGRCFSGEPWLHAGFTGVVNGDDFDKQVREWPGWFGCAEGVVVRPRHQTQEGGKRATEVIVHLPRASATPMDLPVAVSVDLATDGLIERARVYFCTKPITGELRPRETSYPHNGDYVAATVGDFPDVNAEYVSNQFDWNLDGILGTFAPDAYIERGLDRCAGLDEIRAYYAAFPGTNISMVKSNGIYDGETFVLEWATVRVPTASGLAAYDRSPGRRIAALRQYDDSPWAQLGE
jgi:hypothetical protein